VLAVSLSYDKLWKLLIDNHIKRKELREMIEVSSSTMARLSKNQTVSLEVLMKICKVLRCDIGDIIEITDEE
jgi:putative transcriptional regulator